MEMEQPEQAFSIDFANEQIDYSTTFALTNTVSVAAATNQVQFQIPSNVIAPNKMTMSFKWTQSAATTASYLALIHCETIPFFDTGIVNMDGQQLIYTPQMGYVCKLINRALINEMKYKYHNHIFFRQRERARLQYLSSTVDGANVSSLVDTYDIPHLMRLYGRAQAVLANGTIVVRGQGIAQKGYVQYDALGQTFAAYNGNLTAAAAINLYLRIPFCELFPQSFFDLDIAYIRDTLEIRLTTNPLAKVMCQLVVNADATIGPDATAKLYTSNFFSVAAVNAYAQAQTFSMNEISAYVPVYRNLTRQDVPKRQVFGYNDVRYAVRSNDVIRFTGGVPGAKLNWQILSFFTSDGTGGNVYNNANELYNGANTRITTLAINIDGKVLLPQVASTDSPIYENIWTFNMKNRLDIDYYEWQLQNHFWFFDYRNGPLNGKDCLTNDCSIEFNGSFHATPLYILVSNFTKAIIYDENYQVSII